VWQMDWAWRGVDKGKTVTRFRAPIGDNIPARLKREIIFREKGVCVLIVKTILSASSVQVSVFVAAFY
jgi:hypothetical protein